MSARLSKSKRKQRRKSLHVHKLTKTEEEEKAEEPVTSDHYHSELQKFFAFLLSEKLCIHKLFGEVRENELNIRCCLQFCSQ